MPPQLPCVFEPVRTERLRLRLMTADDVDYWQLALEHEGRVIGDVYFTIESVEHAHGEIGWTLHPRFNGRGFMSEAALCRRLGMREEALHLEDMWSKGEWSDTGIYALLAREWRA